MPGITADQSDGAEFETLGGVHRADCNRFGREVAVGSQPPAGETGLCNGRFGALADDPPSPSKDGYLSRLDIASAQVAKPTDERGNLVLDRSAAHDLRLRTTQDRYRLAVFLLSVDLGKLGRQ